MTLFPTGNLKEMVQGRAVELDLGLKLRQLVTVEPSVSFSVNLFLISRGCNFHEGHLYFHGWKQDKRHMTLFDSTPQDHIR